MLKISRLANSRPHMYGIYLLVIWHLSKIDVSVLRCSYLSCFQLLADSICIQNIDLKSMLDILYINRVIDALCYSFILWLREFLSYLSHYLPFHAFIFNYKISFSILHPSPPTSVQLFNFSRGTILKHIIKTIGPFYRKCYIRL